MIILQSLLRRLSALLIIFCLLIITGCGSGDTTPDPTTEGPFATFLKDIELFNLADPIAIVETDQGTFAIELYKTHMPNSVARFTELALAQRYDASKVYNTVNNFAVYMGDKSGTGTEASDVKPLALETHPDITHATDGMVGFVHQSGAQCVSSPNKAQCSQDALNSAKTFFYITLAPTPSLDNTYAVFGKVVKGLQIVKNLRKGNVIQKVTIVERAK